MEEWVNCVYENAFHWLDTSGANLSEIEKRIVMQEDLEAPVKAGDKTGEAQYYLGDKKIGSVAIVAADDVKKAGLLDYLKRCMDALLIDG